MPRAPKDREVHVGQSFGVLALIAGLVLTIAGVAGSIDWLVESQTVANRLTNATPGVLLVVIGAMVLWRYKQKHSTATDSLTVQVSHDIEEHPGGPRSRLSVDAVRRLREEVERARTSDKDRSSGGVK